MPRSKYFRFLFSEADQHRIDLNSIQVDDVPYADNPQIGQPYPQSLKLNFRINDPQNGAPEIWPLFPGDLTFIVDSAANGILPRTSNVQLTSNAYTTWKKEGMLSISLLEKFSTLTSIRKTFDSHQIIFPNRIWYSPVVLPEDFILQSLINELRSTPLTGIQLLKAKQIISTFLSGDSTFKLSVKQTPDLDTVINLTMPTVKMDADGNVELFISTALSQNPLDDFDVTFDPGTDKKSRKRNRLNPVHIRNGAVPARLVYRELQEKMVNSSGKLADVIFKNWPSDTDYIPFRFTRAWRPVRECSLHFPYQILKISKGSAAVANPIFQRLPSHGIFYLKVEPDDDLSESIFISLSNSSNDEQHNMFWLDGSVINAWEIKANKDTLIIHLTDQSTPTNLSVIKLPHIILRRSITREILADIEANRILPKLKLSACTYFTLHRCMKAFVDHRITGGRMFGYSAWATIRPLITDALGEDFSHIFSSGRRYKPRTNLASDKDVSAASGTYLTLMEKLFSNKLTTSSNEKFTKGRAAYYLWQSNTDEFQGVNSHYFSDIEIGHGICGAMKTLGLGSYTIPKELGETNEVWLDRITIDLKSMLKGLKAGAVLQFWQWKSHIIAMKERSLLGDAIFGHSTIFLSLVGTEDSPQGVTVIDQNGITTFIVVDDQLVWTYNKRHYPMEVWLAANWDE